MPRRAIGWVLLLWAAAGCGPSGGNTNNDTNGNGSCRPNCFQEGATRCSADLGSIEICRLTQSGCVQWDLLQDCRTQGLVCQQSGEQSSCVSPESCTDGIQNQNETDVDCGGVCDPCEQGKHCIQDTDCASGACVNGVCAVCKPNIYGCYGNYLRQCGPDGNSWQEVAHCDPHADQVCNPVALSCQRATPIGTTTPTGVYYQYAEFCTYNSPFRGGFDVGSLDDKLYVNRDGQHVDVYRVEIRDSDGDGVIQPNQHPENPDAQGPMEERTLVYEETYDIEISNGAFADACTGGWTYCSNELQPMVGETSLDIYFISQWTGRLGIARWSASSGAIVPVAPWDTSLGCDEVLGYDPLSQTFYVGVYERKIFSWHAPTQEWVLELVYPNLAGAHADGLEVVVDPNTNIPYVYVTDMTSDFIAQYHKRDDGTWEQVNVFRYNRGQGDYIEGMGFGALNHFWMSAVVDPNNIQGTNCIYEIGGGDLSHYVQVE